jgi:Na+/H+ antiporter NhaD/arsenite permease-like protein
MVSVNAFSRDISASRWSAGNTGPSARRGVRYGLFEPQGNRKIAELGCCGSDRDLAIALFEPWQAWTRRRETGRMILAYLSERTGAEALAPDLFWISPFVVLLLSIAVLPLIPKTSHWWEHNRNKLIIALGLGAVTLLYYQFRGYGAGHGEHASPAGWPTVLSVLHHAVLAEYLPFISLLFSLYAISGGICVKGDIPAHPRTNVAFLAIGAVLASVIGTTGASMLLIRPLLKTNSERKRITHTVIFFIFIVSNVGGLLLPTGDPPLFLGYLKGVPFLWTLNLWKEWAFTCALLMAIYWVWDRQAYKHETRPDIARDETQVQKITVSGKINFLLLACVVLATGTLDPGKEFLGAGWMPPAFFREMVQLAFVGLSLLVTPRGVRRDNNFSYAAIIEVAYLFIGIFICMQVPIEILNIKGPRLGIDTPAEFFWATGSLSSFLDNAPTYVVFLETAKSLTTTPGPGVMNLLSDGHVLITHLVAISLGSVFMGANTYIGNGPNFMVKSIAERAGVKMPSFFGYMAYSICILLPAFALVSYLFLC